MLWLCIPLSPLLYKHLSRKTFALWTHNLHNKKSVHFGYPIQWFSVLFAELSNHQSHFGIFPTPSKKLCTYFQSLFNSQGEATTNLFSISIDLLFQTFHIKHNDSVHCMIFYMWFTECNGFELIPVAAYVFLLYCWVVFHGISWTHHPLVAHLQLGGCVRCLHFWAVMNNAAMNVHVQVLCANMFSCFLSRPLE